MVVKKGYLDSPLFLEVQMPQGMQVFDPQGKVVVDLTTRLTRLVGMIRTVDTDGQITLNTPPDTTPFAVNVPDFTGGNGIPADILIENDILYWKFYGNRVSYFPKVPGTIFYGYY
ncbi:hypothetical protein NQ630_07465 [Acinetobacter baumannii]|nr:hypothetical protein [Acinetobacter baumannii]